MSDDQKQFLPAQTPEYERLRMGKPYTELAEDLARETRTVVGVFCDSVFEGKEVPTGLRAEDFERCWGNRPDVRVVRLDHMQIRAFSILFKGRLDVLVFPYGGIYPMEVPTQASGPTLDRFLRKGGAVLTTGEVPFGKQAMPNGEVYGGHDGPLPSEYIYDNNVSGFGVKYYQTRHQPDATSVNEAYLPSLGHKPDIAPSRVGIVINNSSHHPRPHPTHGNVFPERWPARLVHPLMWGTDRFGRTLVTNAVLMQDFETGGRMVCFSHTDEPHPLSPQSPAFESVMSDVLSLLLNRVMVREVETDLACYRQGEPVRVRAELRNFGPAEVQVEVLMEIRAGERIVKTRRQTCRLAPGKTTVRQWTWSPPKFSADEYEVRVVLQKDGRRLSHADNGFVVWNDEIALNGPAMTMENQYFRVGDGSTYVMGTNYYESTRGEIMWYRPNVQRIIEDFRRMHAAGVNYIRPHFHHLKWFKDYMEHRYDKLPEFFSRLEGLDSAMPDERTLRVFDAFICLSQKYGIVYGGDLFTLLPEEMGDPRGWFGTTDAFYCPKRLAVQKEFLKIIDKRYHNVKGISWDLFNEPFYIPDEVVNNYARSLRSALAGGSSDRLITIGGPMILGDAVDYDSPHGRIPLDFINRSPRPSLLQELHIDQPENLQASLKQAEQIRQYAFMTVRNGLAGVCPWSWSRQMRLWQDGTPNEKWDDRLGMHVYDDGTPKPAGQVFTDMAALLRTIRFQRFDHQAMKVYTDRGEVVVHLDQDPAQPTGHRLYHVSDRKCFAAVARSELRWRDRLLASGPDGSYVYAFATGGDDLAGSPTLYAKADLPGRLLIPNRPGGPKSVGLVELLPGKEISLQELQWLKTDKGIEIDLAPNMDAYWVKIEW